MDSPYLAFNGVLPRLVRPVVWPSAFLTEPGGIAASPLTARSFSRDFKKKGMIPLSTYLKQYKVGDIVDVVANGTKPPESQRERFKAEDS